MLSLFDVATFSDRAKSTPIRTKVKVNGVAARNAPVSVPKCSDKYQQKRTELGKGASPTKRRSINLDIVGFSRHIQGN